ncbi:transcription initiation factor TFIID component TAF4 family-domain-containing protein [Mycena pura]|uniref:Transcription initiation factor TFIID subunit 4 n=1 Tax=Mycena pura TaxID=153505 RepID=A0AAD6YDY5_9AGAR|nr:transcription initiation factor TFIID component TAF4 family-domain-containing protein [Mycena pura]
MPTRKAPKLIRRRRLRVLPLRQRRRRPPPPPPPHQRTDVLHLAPNSIFILTLRLASRPVATAYQHYQAYYQQPAYQAYQYAAQQSMARQAITNAAAQQSGGGTLDTADVATLNDALGSAGVDLRAEEETLQRSHDQPQTFRVFEDRSRKQPARPNFDATFLGSTMRSIASHHKVTAGVSEDCVNYLALALRARLQDIVTAMIDAARHRANAHFDRPASLYDDGTAAWGVLVRSDVVKQLAALEKIEREEEMQMRRARQKREEAIHDAVVAALAGEDHTLELPADDAVETDGTARKRQKKRAGSGDVERKMANATASRAAGVTAKYAWLSTGLGKRPKRAVSVDSPLRDMARPYRAAQGAYTPPVADQRLPITVRDAMFVVEKERGHGGGRGAARGWT